MYRHLCLLLLVFAAASPALAANRTVTIIAPASAPPAADVRVVVTALTDAQDAERIGFLHAEYSTDDGRTWKPVYAERLDRSVSRAIDLRTSPEGARTQIRVRVAFRGGRAGDVDYTGAPIAWGESWARWETPPARTATIEVAR